MENESKGPTNLPTPSITGTNEEVKKSVRYPIKESKSISEIAGCLIQRLRNEPPYIDIGCNCDFQQTLDISRTRLNAAVLELKNKGYEVFFMKLPTLDSEDQHTLKVIVRQGVTYEEMKAYLLAKTYDEDQ